MSRRHYPVRIPQSALGIRAQELRTLTRKAWWARRWIAAIEALRLGPRLGRGRQYATDGQVVELLLDGPHVEAVIAGSRPDPYKVTMDFTALDEAASARVASRLKADPMLLARVLVGDLPTKIEEMFLAEGVPLFPAGGAPGHYDITMKCSCPDWARPCKHLVAVLFLLGEEQARRPAALLALRGLQVDDLFPPPPMEPRTSFAFPAEAGHAATCEDPAPIIRRLGPIPYWRGTARCVDSLAKMAARAQPVARAAAEGESIDLR